MFELGPASGLLETDFVRDLVSSPLQCMAVGVAVEMKP
jgi:hypothetical protein